MQSATVGSLLAIFGLLAAGQPAAAPVQVFRFARPQTAQSAGEIATAIRTIAEANVKASDNPPSLTVQGTSEQVALANWLFVELDQPAGPPPNAAIREYKLAGNSDNLVRVYYVANAQTEQQFQEIATAIRTVPEIRRIFTVNSTRAMIARGNADQIALTDWLLPLMDKPLGSPVQHSTSGQQTIPDPKGEGVTQVFYVANAPAVNDFQELAITIRTMSQIRRVFTYNEARAIVVRGLAGQLDMAAWLFNELDQPGGAGTHDYQTPGSDDVLRVFYLDHLGDVKNIEGVVAQIHAATNVQRAFNYNKRTGLILRGTASQMAMAEQLVQQLNKR